MPLMYAQGDFVDKTFYLANVQQGYTNNQGKPYLCIALADQDEDLDGHYWDMEIGNLGAEKGDCARVQGTIQVFNGSVQLKITSLHKVAPVDMMREGRTPLDELMTRLDRVVAHIPADSISNDLWERFVQTDMFRDFVNAPAAMTMHHNYKHGLLEHSVSVADIVMPRLPEDEFGIGTVAAIMHDIGKVDTYAFEGPAVVMTDQGKMLGHIVLGVMRLQPLLEGFPDAFKTVFLNAVVGHHGKYEWGSPELPKTRFAWLLHWADQLDSVSQHIVDMRDWNGWMSGDKMFRTELLRF
ncbi:3'-5' exoribonuclease YhaM [Peptococcaceae bacterium CEB3]|nr:3'-5' exoribonuclease YhaM [Peptococcaceae bacterium CEB3]